MSQIVTALTSFFSFIGGLFSSAIEGISAFMEIQAFALTLDYNSFFPWWLSLICIVVFSVSIIKLLLSVILNV